MQKHRKKKKHYRKIAIAAGALAIVGVPTAAMACLGGPDTGRMQSAGRSEMRPWHSAPTLALGSPASEAPAALPTSPAESSPAAAESAPEAPAKPVVQAPRPPQQQPTRKPVASVKPQVQAPTAETAPKTAAAPASGATAEVLALVNQERAAVGCPALTLNAKLTAAAQSHSQDMAAHANMSHTGSDGSDPGQRITRAGYTWRTYGENVAYGYSTPAAVMEGWMNSPGHKRNILDCSFKEIGIGYAQPNHYWTQDFGAAR
ncbi:CAP domain-containing protein [Streptomyces sp. NPDC007369]|uniref:CAP domain-containing protein n=1 Tax=Streptomyces sp. NPDC007369 TaxID=3154589 RepID=UPI00340E4B22